MYYAEELYDDSLIIEDLLEDGLFDEDYDFEDDFEDDLLDDDLYGEDFSERRRRPRWGRRRRRRISPKISSNVKRKSNFGRSISANKAYVTKKDLKVALNSISRDVNGIKKTTLSNGKTVKALDGKYSSIVKDIARKDVNQTKVLKNMQTMNMLGTLINKPKFDEANLEIEAKNVAGEKLPGTVTIKEKVNDKTVNFDQTMSLLLPLLTTQGNSGSGSSSSNNMMLPLLLLLTQNKDDSSSDTNSMLPLILMMTMNK